MMANTFTTPQIMAWIMDTFSMLRGYSIPGVVTGKPIAIGGSLGRDKATARGCLYVTNEAMSEIGKATDGATVSIQGFGNAGMHAAELFAEAGYKVVAVSDSRGGVGNPKGLDVSKLIAFKSETGSVSGFSGGDKLSNKEVLECACDVLVPAALENQIGAEEASLLKVRLVAEGANGPTTPAGDRVLAERGIPVIPDILANAGGVTVSYYEWVQNRRSEKWSLEEVDRRLEAAMRNTYQRMVDFAAKHRCDPRTACYGVALERIVQAYLERGIFP